MGYILNKTQLKQQLVYQKTRAWVLSCVELLQPHRLYPARLLSPWIFPGKNTGEGCHFQLQGIFPTQKSNPHLLHCRQILYHWATWETLGLKDIPE